VAIFGTRRRSNPPGCLRLNRGLRAATAGYWHEAYWRVRRAPRTCRPAPDLGDCLQYRAVFDALVSGEYRNLALFSCFVNGEPAAAIVAINRDGGNLRHQAAVRQRHAFADTDRSRRAACQRRGALSAASGALDARSFPVRLRRRPRALLIPGGAPRLIRLAGPSYSFLKSVLLRSTGASGHRPDRALLPRLPPRSLPALCVLKGRPPELSRAQPDHGRASGSGSTRLCKTPWRYCPRADQPTIWEMSGRTRYRLAGISARQTPSHGGCAHVVRNPYLYPAPRDRGRI